MPYAPGTPGSVVDGKTVRAGEDGNNSTGANKSPSPATPSAPNPSLRNPDAVKSASNSFNVLRYPLDSGNQNRHSIKIGIFTRNDSQSQNVGIIPGNRFDARKGGKLVTPQSTGTTVEGTTAANLVTAGGKALDTVGNLAGNLSGARSKVGSALATGGAVAATAAQIGAMAASVAMSGLQLGGSRTSKEALGWINLYMPDGISLVNSQNWDAVSMTEAMGVAGLLSQGGAAEQALTFGETTGAVGDKYRDAYLQKNRGYALNPQLEVLYSGPKNRSFVFDFTLTPRNAKEADQVWLIIQTLKFHAAPEYADASGSNTRYLIPPSEFGIEFLMGPNVNTNLPSIGPCVLTNIDVNYSPNDTYATFYDGMPVQIKLQLQFMEIVILTKQDILAGY